MPRHTIPLYYGGSLWATPTRHITESRHPTRLALNMLKQSRYKLEFRATVGATKLRLIMRRRSQVLVEPIKRPKRAVAEIAFIRAPIERGLVRRPGNKSSCIRRTSFYPAVNRNLRDNLELMHSSRDLTTTDTVTTRFNVHSNRRRRLEHLSAKWALERPPLVDRRSIVLVNSNP